LVFVGSLDTALAKDHMSDASPSLGICFCIPTFRGQMASQTAVTLFEMVNLLRDIDVPCTLVTFDGSEVVFARNRLATIFYETHQYSHMFFLDDDMAFEPSLILDMLRADKPVIGAVAPKRKFYIDRFYKAAKDGASIEAANAAGVDFVIRHLGKDKVTVTDGMCVVDGVGMATTLIQYDVLDRLVKGGHVEKREEFNAASGKVDTTYGFFDLTYSVDGKFLSEDFSFCHRFREKLNGETWIVLDREIGHIGQFTYQANYMELLRSQQPG
jgi:hypothetical protein